MKPFILASNQHPIIKIDASLNYLETIIINKSALGRIIINTISDACVIVNVKLSLIKRIRT